MTFHVIYFLNNSWSGFKGYSFSTATRTIRRNKFIYKETFFKPLINLMIPKTFDLFRRKFKPLLLNRPFVSNQVTFLWNAFCSSLICQMEYRHTAVIFEYEFHSSTLLVHQAAASPASMHSYWSVHIENIEHQISNVTSFLGNCFC